MNTERVPMPGEIYRHFKNKLYQIITVAYHSETKEKYVVYQALYGEFKTYIRPYDMFMSEVDHIKYPDVKDKYRFTKVEILETDTNVNTQVAAESICTQYIGKLDDTDGQANPYLLEFLDKDTNRERIEYLNSIKNQITDRLINDISAAMDITIESGDLDMRFESLMSCLSTMARFECQRLR